MDEPVTWYVFLLERGIALKISFIGLGSVGMYYSEGLIANGASVKGYDIMVGNPRFEERVAKCREIGIDVVENMEALLSDADIILVATAPAVAFATAESAKPYLKEGQVYVELNSAVPAVKRQIEKSLAEVGVSVVDGTTMSSVDMMKYKALINFAGPKAKEVVAVLQGYKMNAHYFGEVVGEACAFKVVRSIFMKGYEAVLMECAEAAYHYGVMDNVLESIAQFFDPKPAAEQFTMFINTDAVFAKRRGEEVGAVAQMLADDGINNTMAAAAAQKLGWIADLGLSEHYNNNVPADQTDVIMQLCEREKKRAETEKK